MADFRITPLDLDNDTDMHAASAVCARSLAHGRADFAPIPTADRVALWRAPKKDHKTQLAICRAGDAVIGLGKIS